MAATIQTINYPGGQTEKGAVVSANYIAVPFANNNWTTVRVGFRLVMETPQTGDGPMGTGASFGFGISNGPAVVNPGTVVQNAYFISNYISGSTIPSPLTFETDPGNWRRMTYDTRFVLFLNSSLPSVDIRPNRDPLGAVYSSFAGPSAQAVWFTYRRTSPGSYVEVGGGYPRAQTGPHSAPWMSDEDFLNYMVSTDLDPVIPNHVTVPAILSGDTEPSLGVLDHANFYWNLEDGIQVTSVVAVQID